MTYTTVTGDTFDIVAYKMYGDERQALIVIEANIEHADTIVFKGGIKLNIPDIEVVSSINLPPWKRGALSES